MKFAKRVKPSLETVEGPWKAAPGVTVSDKGDVYKPGETVPDRLVKANRWLVEAGRVVGKPKTKKTAKKGKS